MSRSVDLISIGECMNELSRQPDGRFSLAFGGDSFNTAVYASRLGLATAYGTALGDDPCSAGILALAEAEGVETGAIPRLPGRVPGLYIIETDATGERRFFYWRDTSPARELFELETSGPLAALMRQAPLVYFSGITLSLYSETGLDRFEAALAAAKSAGARIAFDGNYRPRGWRGESERARRVFSRFLRLVDMALPTFDDEAMLWGDKDPAATVERLRSAGVGEVAVKHGADGALVTSGAATSTVPVPREVVPVDTTAAGDSFNAGYLAARIGGAPPTEAASRGRLRTAWRAGRA